MMPNSPHEFSNITTHWQHIAKLAVHSLIQEALLSPKPGLVDRYNNGSHHDMNLALFIRSAQGFYQPFYDYLKLGYTLRYHHPEHLFVQLRTLGQKTEHHMFDLTKGINTHKGAHFTFSLLLAAIGATWDMPRQFTFDHMKHLCRFMGAMSRSLIHTDLNTLDNTSILTHGEQLYQKYRITGIRGEAAAGYPTIHQIILPHLQHYKHLDQEERYLRLLLQLIAHLEDSNILYRGNAQALEQLQQLATHILQNTYGSKTRLIAALSVLDYTLITQHLSPGGSADFLAIAIFIDTYCQP